MRCRCDAYDAIERPDRPIVSLGDRRHCNRGLTGTENDQPTRFRRRRQMRRKTRPRMRPPQRPHRRVRAEAAAFGRHPSREFPRAQVIAAALLGVGEHLCVKGRTPSRPESGTEPVRTSEFLGHGSSRLGAQTHPFRKFATESVNVRPAGSSHVRPPALTKGRTSERPPSLNRCRMMPLPRVISLTSASGNTSSLRLSPTVATISPLAATGRQSRRPAR